MAEVGDAEQVLQRLPPGAPGQQRVVRLGLAGQQIVDEREPAAVDAEDVGQQRVRVIRRRGHSGRLQQADGSAATLRQAHGR